MAAEQLHISRLTPADSHRLTEIEHLINTYFHSSDAENPRWAREAFEGKYPNLDYRYYIAETSNGNIVAFIAGGLMPLALSDETTQPFAMSIEWRLTIPAFEGQGISGTVFQYMRNDLQEESQKKGMIIAYYFGETVDDPKVEISSNKKGRKRIYGRNPDDPTTYIELPYYEPTDQINWKTGKPDDSYSHIARHLMIENTTAIPIDPETLLRCVIANYHTVHYFPPDFFETNEGFDSYNNEKTTLYTQLHAFLTEYPQIELISRDERLALEQHGATFIHHDVE